MKLLNEGFMLKKKQVVWLLSKQGEKYKRENELNQMINGGERGVNTAPCIRALT